MSTGPVSLVSVPSRTTSVRPSPLRVPGELPCLNHLLRVCAYSEITLRFLCQILRLSTDARLSSRLSVFRPSQTRTGHLVNEVVACAIGSTRSGRPNIWMGFSASTVCSQRLASLVTSTLESGTARHICLSAYLVTGLYVTWYTENGLDCWLQVSGFTIGHQDMDQRVMCISLMVQPNQAPAYLCESLSY